VPLTKSSGMVEDGITSDYGYYILSDGSLVRPTAWEASSKPTVSGLTVKAGRMNGTYTDASDLELWWYGWSKWRNHHIPVTSITPSTSTTDGRIMTPVMFNWANQNDYGDAKPRPDKQFYIMNAEYDFNNNGVTNQFQTDINSTRTAATTIRYKGTTNLSTAADATAIAPQLETLVEITGTSPTARVQNVEFSGLSFEHTTWQDEITDGASSSQSDAFITGPGNGAFTDSTALPEGAVEIRRASNITFNNDKFANLGSAGIVIETATDDVTIKNSTVASTAGSGIITGSDHNSFIDTADEAPVVDTRIYNNTITSTNKSYLSGAPIIAFYNDGLDIQHNTISDSPWSGISLGWDGWQTAENDSVTSRNTFIGYNKISQYNQVVQDGGAIYTLGQQPNTEIVGNYFHSAVQYMASIYADEGSAYLSIHDNVMEDPPYSFGCEGYEWLYANAGSHDMYIADNHLHKTGYTVCGKDRGERSSVVNNTNETTWSTAAQAIISAAGTTTGTITSPRSCVTGDLACGKNATFVHNGNLDYGLASTPLTYPDSYLPQNAISGFAGLVSSSASNNSSYVVDLLDEYDIGEVKFNGFIDGSTSTAFAYSIDTSRDGLTWTSVAAGTRSTTSDPPSDLSFGSVKARYVRMTPYSGTIGRTGVTQFQVFAGTAVTAQTAVSTSSSAISSSTLKLWLRADQGVTTNGTDLVSTWVDQSGNGNSATVPYAYTTLVASASAYSNVSKKPALVTDAVNGLPVVRFDGWDDSLAAPLTGAYPSFTVAVSMRPADFGQLITTGGWSRFMLHGDGSNGGVYAGTDESSRITPTNTGTDVIVPGQWERLIFTYDGSTSTGKLYKDGVLLATKTSMTAPVSWTTFALGENVDFRWKRSGTVMNGDVGEVLVYNSAADAARVAVLDTYLARWSSVVQPGTYSLANKGSGLVVSKESASSRFEMNTRAWNSSQSVHVYDLGTGYYKVASDDRRMAMGVEGSSTAAGARIVESAWTGDDSQLWTPTKVVSGSSTYYYFTNKKSGLVLDVLYGSQSPGADLQQYAYNGSNAQLFSLATPTAVSIGASAVSLTTGSYTQAQLSALGISSTASQLIKVLDGYQAIAYSADSYTGTATAIGYVDGGQSVSNVKSLKVLEAPTAAVSYEAEWQAKLGTAVASSITEASRQWAVGLTSSGEGIQITNVQASRHIALRYRTGGGPGTLSVYVNGVDVGTISLSDYGEAEKYHASLGDDFAIPEGATVQIKRDSGDTSTYGVWLDTVTFSF
jgi:hypothetical protein